MSGRMKVLLVALALGAVAVITTGATAKSQQATTADGLTAQFNKGDIRGIVEAQRARGTRKVRVAASLHGLTAGGTYLVAGSSRRCSQVVNVVDGADFLVWQRTVKANPLSDDLFASARVSRHGALGSVKSVRIYAVPAIGRPTQQACALVDMWEHA